MLFRSFGGVAFASLNEGLANGSVLLFDDAIRAGVVRGDADVVDTIPVREPVQCSDVGRTVVSDDLFDGTPAAQYLLEKKHTQGAAVLHAQGVPLRPSSEGAAGLSDISEATNVRHQHGVDIYLTEEVGGDGDSRRDPDLGCLAELALVTSADVPLDILLKEGPPELVEECTAGGIKALMPEAVVSVADERKTEWKGDAELVTPLILTMPEPSFCEKEVLRLLEQTHAGSVVEVVRLFESGEVTMNELEFIVGSACFGV